MREISREDEGDIFASFGKPMWLYRSGLMLCALIAFTPSARAETLTLQCTFPNGVYSIVTLDYESKTVRYVEGGASDPNTVLSPIVSRASFSDIRIDWRQNETINGERAVVTYYLDRIASELGYSYSTSQTGRRSARATCARAGQKF